MTKTRALLVFLVTAVTCNVCVGAKGGQDSSATASPTYSCDKANKTNKNDWIRQVFHNSKPCTKTLKLDVDDKKTKSIQVPNDSKVKLEIRKGFLDDCKIETVVQEIPPEDPLSALSKLLGGLPKVEKQAAAASQAMVALRPPPPDEINRKFDELEQELKVYSDFPERYKDKIDQIQKFTACESDNCKDLPTYVAKREELLRNRVAFFGTNSPPDTKRLEERAHNLVMELKRYDSKKDPWLESAEQRLGSDIIRIEALRGLREAHTLILKRFNEIASYTPTGKPFTQDLPPAANEKVKVTVTCTNHFSKQAADPVANITFSNPPFATGTTGVVLSPISKHPLGIVSLPMTSSSGVTTVSNYVGYTSSSGVQLIPFGFANFKLYGTSALDLNFSAGAGINPNNGGTQAEYLTGLSFQTHKVYFGVGAHFARFPYPTNGFYLGETIPYPGPSVSATTLPINWRTTIHLGIFFSYTVASSSKPTK